MLEATAMLTHKQAFAIVSAAVERLLGDQPRSVAIYCTAIGCLESAYGSSWKPPGNGSHNWGAIQHRSPPCNPSHVPEPGKPGCFSYEDSTPQADGTSKKYRVCFRAYADDNEGAEDLVKTVYSHGRQSVLLAAQAEAVWQFSAALYDTTYYQGFGPTREARIQHHADRVRQLVRDITAAIDAPDAELTADERERIMGLVSLTLRESIDEGMGEVREVEGASET